MAQAITEATPWLDDIVADIGVREIKGKAANAKIIAYFAEVGHPECESDEIAWCAARTGAALKRCGIPIPPTNVNLMARSYLTWGVECEPKRGAIVVFPRGKSKWQGHVGIVERVEGDTVHYVAGNQSDAVGRGSAKVDAALGYRWPVRPTVKDLRKAGSTEVKKGDRVQNTGLLAVLFGPIIAAIRELFGSVPDVPKFTSIPETLSFWQQCMEGVNAVGRLLAENPWLAGSCLGGLVLAFLGHSIKQSRVAKAKAGVPLSGAVVA